MVLICHVVRSNKGEEVAGIRGDTQNIGTQRLTAAGYYKWDIKYGLLLPKLSLVSSRATMLACWTP